MPDRRSVNSLDAANPRAPDDVPSAGAVGASSVSREITVLLENGLHMAPASEIVKLAERHGCVVSLQKGSNRVNGNSILDMLTLAVEKGQTVLVEIRGEKSEDALREVIELLEGRTSHR